MVHHTQQRAAAPKALASLLVLLLADTASSWQPSLCSSPCAANMGAGRMHPVAVRRSPKSLPLPARFGRGVVLCAEGPPGGGEGERDRSEDRSEDAKLASKLRPAEVTPEADREQLMDVGMRFDGFWALLDAWGRSGLSEKARPMPPDHLENLYVD